MNPQAEKLVLNVEIEMLMGQLRTIANSDIPKEEKMWKMYLITQQFQKWINDQYAKT